MTHVKPTREELQAKADAALKEIEEMDKAEAEGKGKDDNPDNPPADPEKDKNKNKPPVDIEEDDAEDIEEDEDDDTPPEKRGKEDNPPDDPDKDKNKDKKENKGKEGEDNPPDDEDDPDKEDKEDWKKRYADSTRQEQLSRLKEQKLSEAYDKAGEIPEPTEAELKAEYPNWDQLSDFEKTMAKKTLHNDKRFNLIENTRKDIKKVEEWHKQVDEFAKDPRTLVNHPELEGKIDSFKVYASKEKRIGNAMPELVNSFLYLVSKQRTKHTGQMFETGTGGSNERRQPKQTGKLTMDQATALRKSNYKLYTQYLKEGKIDQSTII